MHTSFILPGETKRQFDNLKKRFSKGKAMYKKATRSGSGSREAKQAEIELKKKLFLELACTVLKT